MKTEITKERLKEYFYPSKNFYRGALDGAIVDYAEIEINPTGIKKLEDNLDSENCERIVVYVHFDADTDIFNKMFLCATTVYGDEELDVNKLLNDEERQNIIEAGLESLHKWRNTDEIIDQEGYEIKQLVEKKI